MHNYKTNGSHDSFSGDSIRATAHMRWLIGLAVFLVSLLMVSACTPTSVTVSGSRTSNNSDSDATDLDSNPSDDSGLTDSGGSSGGEACDESNPHACAEGFFCAALDGQPAKCFGEHTREDGKSCTDHVQCASSRCNLDAGVCTASPGASCTPANGCGPGASDDINYVCSDGTCKPSTGDNGSACTWSYDCLSGVCKNNQCVSGEHGSDCQAPEHCNSYLCVNGTCSNGEVGDACQIDTDCASVNCVDGICEESVEGPGQFCLTDDDCEVGRCVGDKCSTGELGSTCQTTTDCQNGLNCDRECPEFYCPSTCTDGKKGSPCITRDACENDMRCTDDTPWQPTGAPLALNSCADEETCDFHLRDCDGEDDWCMRTADGPICGTPGNGQPLSPCTDDTDCRSGVCSDHGFGNFKCSAGNGWAAPCTVISIPGEPVDSVGCDGQFVCDTTIGPPPFEVLTFGYCGALPGHFCYSKFESTNVTFNHRGGCAPGGVAACAPSTTKSKYCENNPNLTCSTDNECACHGVVLSPGQTCNLGTVAGKQCVTDYVCL